MSKEEMHKLASGIVFDGEPRLADYMIDQHGKFRSLDEAAGNMPEMITKTPAGEFEGLIRRDHPNLEPISHEPLSTLDNRHLTPDALAQVDDTGQIRPAAKAPNTVAKMIADTMLSEHCVLSHKTRAEAIVGLLDYWGHSTAANDELRNAIMVLGITAEIGKDVNRLSVASNQLDSLLSPAIVQVHHNLPNLAQLFLDRSTASKTGVEFAGNGLVWLTQQLAFNGLWNWRGRLAKRLMGVK